MHHIICKQICLCPLVTSFGAASDTVVTSILHPQSIITSMVTLFVRGAIMINFSYESYDFGHLQLSWLQLFVKNIRLSQSANFSRHVTERQKHLQATRNGPTRILAPFFEVLVKVHHILNCDWTRKQKRVCNDVLQTTSRERLVAKEKSVKTGWKIGNLVISTKLKM